MHTKDSLLTLDFLSINLVMFFAFCNMAVFYSFYSYLGQIGIPLVWRGFLVSLEPFMAFSLRLFLTPYLTSKNIRALTTLMIIACATLSLILFAYVWAISLPALIVLRMLHGVAFVLLVSVCYTLLARIIPPQKSAQAFGLVSVTSLLPYSIIPFFTERLFLILKNDAYVYAYMGLLGLPAAGVAFWIHRRAVTTALQSEQTTAIPENKMHLPPRPILALLLVGFLFYFSYATVFYFVKNLAQPVTGNPAYDIGLFFSLYTVVMLCVRLAVGKWMDRVPKNKALLLFSAGWLGVFLLLPQMLSPTMFYLLALGYGLCVSMLLPMLSSEIFVQSEAGLRAAHTNMVLFTMDAGYFLSPLIGGLLLSIGSPSSLPFYLCAGFILIAMIFIAYAGGYHVHPKSTRTL